MEGDFINPRRPDGLTGISLTEIFWMSYMVDGRIKYVITSDMFRRWYYLYSVDRNGKCTKTKYKSNIPTELYSHCR